LHAEIESIRKTLPKDVELQPFYDQSEIVKLCHRQCARRHPNRADPGVCHPGAVLRDWGTSLVAGMVIPATVAVTFIALKVAGATFNLMTLGGLAAAVGLVIDDAIGGGGEHRHAPRRRPEPLGSHPQRHPRNWQAAGGLHHHAHRGLPAAHLHHRRHRRLLPRPRLTVAMALLTSLFLALTWTPTLSHFLLRRGRSAAKNPREENSGAMRSWSHSTSACCGARSRIRRHSRP